MGKMNEIALWLKHYLRYRIGIRRLDRKARKKDKNEGYQNRNNDIYVKYCDIMTDVIYLIDLSVKDFKNKDLKGSTEALVWVNWYIRQASKLLDK